MSTHIILATPKKSRLKASKLNEVFKRFPKLDDDDRAAFKKKIQAIRKNMKSKIKSWD